MNNEKLYGLWRTGEEPHETGWVTAKGRVLVSADPSDLEGMMPDTEIREYPPVISHKEWNASASTGRDDRP